MANRAGNTATSTEVKFGVAVMRVHHQMRRAVDIYIREHHVFLRVSTQSASYNDVC